MYGYEDTGGVNFPLERELWNFRNLDLITRNCRDVEATSA